MKSRTKHEKITILLAVIAVISLILSFCLRMSGNVKGILQGLATGILSGIVLLFITGIKTKDYKNITKQYNILHKSRECLIKIEESYGTIYHKTYHGKKEKMDFKTYLGLINATYREYQNAYMIKNEIKFEEISDNKLKRELEEYFSLMEEKMGEIGKKIRNITFDDKEALNDISEDFYFIQEKAFELKIKIEKIEDRLYMERENINNSLI